MNFFEYGGFKTAMWMTVSISMVGFILFIGGAALTGIAYTELRPNYGDTNYYSYTGASLQKTVGPIMLAFGTLLLIVGCAFLGSALFATQSQHSKISSKSSSRKEVY